MNPQQQIVVMGVTGSGETTIGTQLAEHLRWEFADADDFHPAANIAKMTTGEPLTDTDRWPWLHTLLQSQFDTLEPLQCDENGMNVEVDNPTDQIVESISTPIQKPMAHASS